MRFLPNVPDDAAALRDARIDLAIGVYGELPPEIRTRTLFHDRFVCAVREGRHRRSPRRARRVARAVPYFVAALSLVAETDYVVTVSERIARVLAPRFGLRTIEAPLSLEPYALDAIWHPRMDGDAAHAFLRDVLVRAARELAPLTGGRRRPPAGGPR